MADLPAAPRWDGDRLMLNNLCVGSVHESRTGVWFCRARIGETQGRPHPNETAARDALVVAVVRALGDGA